jgi:hypothetical protein
MESSGRDGKTILKPTYPSISAISMKGLPHFNEGDKSWRCSTNRVRVQVKATFEEIGPYMQTVRPLRKSLLATETSTPNLATGNAPDFGA